MNGPRSDAFARAWEDALLPRPARTILFADDQAALRAIVRATLGTRYRLLEAADGSVALAMVEAEHPDVALLDVNMPGLDGYSVCRRIKANPLIQATRVLILTGHGEDESRDQALAVGADGFLTKPFSPSALLAEVERCVDGPDAVPRVLDRPKSIDSSGNEALDLTQMLLYARELNTVYDAARERAARFRRLVEIGRDLTSATDLTTLLRLALQHALGFGGFSGGRVLLATEAGPLREALSLGRLPQEIWPDVELRRNAIRTLDEGTPVVSDEDVAAVYIPLVTPGGRPIGVLALARLGHPIDENDIDALQLLGSQLAAAVESTLLGERLRRSLNALLAMHETGRILGADLNLEEIAQNVLNVVTSVASFAAGVIRLQGDGEPVEYWHAPGHDATWHALANTRAANDARRATMASRAPRSFIDRTALDPPYYGGWCLPMQVQDRIVGVLEILGTEDTVRDAPVDVLLSLASQAGSGLENARLYRTLADRERRLQEMVRKLLLAQEEERRRVAYEVHDGLAQVAAAAYQHLQSFARHYRVRAAAAQQDLNRTLELSRQTVGEARRVIANMRPTVLDDFGLMTALRLEIEALQNEGWQATYDESMGSRRLPPHIETALFRVAQEALTNIHKHAQTTRVHVSLRRSNTVVRLLIQDWGRGFFVSTSVSTGPGERVGLMSMRERVEVLGGTLHIESEPGAGTRVIALVPATVVEDELEVE